MKLRRILCMILALVTLTLVACNTPTPPDGGGNGGGNEGGTSSENGGGNVSGAFLSKDKTYRILFIGNSYTFYNDMPTAIFGELAKAAGYTVEIDAITNGYHMLEKFADPADEFGAQVDAALTGEKKYDFVILQEHSIRPADPTNHPKFYAAVRNLATRIRATGAEPILYATWGRKTGSDTLSAYGWTSEDMTWRLAASYAAIGKELSIPVAHVGIAFLEVVKSLSGFELYNADLSHPSYSGSYLAAATLFAKIFGMDPAGIAFHGTLDAGEAAFLSECARSSVADPSKIPEKYIVSSEGK